MENNKITAAILTHALWNSRVQSTKDQMGSEDWKLVVEDYVKIISDLDRRDSSVKVTSVTDEANPPEEVVDDGEDIPRPLSAEFRGM